MPTVNISELLPILNKYGLKYLAPLISKWTQLDWFNNSIINPLQKKYPGDPRSLIDKYTEVSEIAINFNEKQLENIPASGPCVIIANHPTDLLDHAIITTALSKVRRDYKFTANNAVEKLKLWNEIIFSLQLGREASALSHNVKAIRSCTDWLNAGHVLITYPGAKPSKLSKKIRGGRDVWSTLPCLLAKKTNSPIIPMKIILKEPIHHKLLKQFARHAYSFLLFRVLKHFSSQSVTVLIGKKLETKNLTSNKKLLGKQLESAVIHLKPQ